MSVITRFAPSPTGYLHIGSARTGLFNWLFAKHHGGVFHLRVEDTDRKRSTEDAVRAILEGMKWLGLDWDGEVIYQSTRQKRHAEIAKQLLEADKAYYCYCTPEELAAHREEAKKNKQPLRYSGKCRHRIGEVPKDVKPAIRLKVPQEGRTTINDMVQGSHIIVENNQLDDMILLRSDGTPTYMLAVVVDDHDMKISHVIRGDDHLTNTIRQAQIYQALEWDFPQFAHIPLIHGADGAKLSKRHGALGIDAYHEMGMLPEAMRNYLLRLGWSHGDDEIISTEQAVKWFDIDAVGKSPSRFDMEKLKSLNSHYIKNSDNEELIQDLLPLFTEMLGYEVSEVGLKRLTKGIDGLKQRAKTLVELAEQALFYVAESALPLPEKATKILEEDGKTFIPGLIEGFEKLSQFDSDTIESFVKEFAASKEVKMGKIGGCLRAALTYSTQSPSLFELIPILGKEETIKRLQHAL